jgi:hypothetical protein
VKGFVIIPAISHAYPNINPPADNNPSTTIGLIFKHIISGMSNDHESLVPYAGIATLYDFKREYFAGVYSKASL